MSTSEIKLCDRETLTSARILVIEDERSMRQFLRATLVGQGYGMTEFATGSAGVKHALRQDPDLVILDLGLPDMDGIEVIRRIRENSDVPILVTSARDRTVGGVTALHAGANDYLRKPFTAVELLHRLDSLLRFVNLVPENGEGIFLAGALRVDLGEHSVFVDEDEIDLTSTEYKLLHCLIRHAGGIATINQIRNELGVSRTIGDEMQLRTAVSQLRRKLNGDATQPRFLVAEPGIGYRLEVH
jgi:two-component system, OmpR family, KDP operon response regulator KdpE